MLTGETAIIELENDRLRVKIAYPGAVYKGSRFDWNGFITQVQLDGRHTFCVPESLAPGKGSGGQGFCSEFGIEEALGYKETSTGDYFTKIGVGLLRKPDEKPYDFFGNYQISPVNTSVTAASDKAEFYIKAPENNGYSYEYKKEIIIYENHIVIHYLLKNTGCKVIDTSEYCHNFIGIDDERVSGNYELKLPGEINIDDHVGELYAGNSVVTWPEAQLKQEFYCVVKGYKKDPGYSWELYNRKAGAGLREIDDFEVSKFALWGSRHVISPETFIRLEISPGHSVAWERKYEFFSFQ